jgi:hypothetical protein
VTLTTAPAAASTATQAYRLERPYTFAQQPAESSSEPTGGLLVGVKAGLGDAAPFLRRDVDVGW